MTAPERICVVNCGLPADQCACYRALMNEAYPLVTIDPSILAADLARVTAELETNDKLLLVETQLSLDRLARAEAAEAKVARLVNEPIEAVLAKITMWREYDDTRDWVAPGKTLLAELRAVISDIEEAPDA